MSKAPAHDWFLPRLVTLMKEADEAGFARDLSVAVITDLVNGALAASVPPPEEEPNRDIGEPDSAVNQDGHRSLPDDPGDTTVRNPLDHVHGNRGFIGGHQL